MATSQTHHQTSQNGTGTAPSDAKAAVFVASAPLPDGTLPIIGPDLSTLSTTKSNDQSSLNGIEGFLASYRQIGFQATSLATAIEIVQNMRKWRLSDEPLPPPDPDQQPLSKEQEEEEENTRRSTKCTIFLGYTSNLVSSGLREIIRYLVQHNHISAIVTTAGGIEEDFIKCLGKTYLADFNLDGAELRKKGLNRIGNLVVPNENYCKFEDWVVPILDKMLEEQKEEGMVWTPSEVIRRLGKEINNEESIYYWAYKNNIPVFCPALTDGSLGDMIYFHSYRSPGLIIDIVRDIRKINDMAHKAKKAGMIILGGGVCKHQIANAMLFRNGADYAVYINTGQEFDGSDSGARPDEAVSWGKLKASSQTVKVFADATLVFPLLVASTFASGK